MVSAGAGIPERRMQSSHLQASIVADSSGRRTSPPLPPTAAVITVSSSGASTGESSRALLEGSAVLEQGAIVVVDIGAGGGGPTDPEADEVCKIFYLSPKIRRLGSAELIRIGYGGKGKLEITPQQCGEA